MEDLFSLLIGLAVIVVIFLVCREIVCWYAKINERVNLLEEQVELLKEISRKLDRPGV